MGLHADIDSVKAAMQSISFGMLVCIQGRLYNRYLSPELACPEGFPEPALHFYHCWDGYSQTIAGLTAAVQAAGCSHVLLKPNKPNHI